MLTTTPRRCRVRVPALLAALALALVVAGCGGGAATARVVSADEGRARLVVEPSALPEGVAADAITMRAVAAAEFDGEPPLFAYEFGPAGTVFREPLSLFLEIDPATEPLPALWLLSGDDFDAIEPLALEAVTPVRDATGALHARVEVRLPHLSLLLGARDEEFGWEISQVEPSRSSFAVGEEFDVSFVTVLRDAAGSVAVPDARNRRVRWRSLDGPWQYSGQFWVNGLVVDFRENLRSAGTAQPLRADPEHEDDFREQPVIGLDIANPTRATYEATERRASSTVTLVCGEPGRFQVSFAGLIARPMQSEDLRGGRVERERTWTSNFMTHTLRWAAECVAATAGGTAVPTATAVTEPTTVPTAVATSTPDRATPSATPAATGGAAGAAGGNVTCVTFLGETTCTDASGNTVPPPR